MPGMDGTGPAGAGPMTRRGIGACAGGRRAGRGNGSCISGGFGRGFGPGRGSGYGPGIGRGLGRRMGWFSVGYGQAGEGAATNIKNMLQERLELLRAELERTENLLMGASEEDATSGSSPSGPAS